MSRVIPIWNNAVDQHYEKGPGFLLSPAVIHGMPVHTQTYLIIATRLPCFFSLHFLTQREWVLSPAPSGPPGTTECNPGRHGHQPGLALEASEHQR